MSEVLKSAAIRAARSFLQAFLAVYLAGVVGAEELGELADQRLLVASVLGGLVAALSLVQNLLEGWKDVSYPRG